MLGRTALAVLALLASVAEALVVTLPTAVSIWTEGAARIEWSLLPETFPPPATPFFDVYIRNGVGAMYTPSLNLLLATRVDSTASTYLDVAQIDKFRRGPGYQLFFSDPASPSTFYCESDVFAIGSSAVDGPPPTQSSSGAESSSTDSASASSASSRPDSSSSADSTLTDTSSNEPAATSTSSESSSTSSGMITSVVTSSSASPSPSLESSSSSTTTARTDGITAAPAPGGPNEQGFNLVPSGASSVRASSRSGGALALSAAFAAGAWAALL
ncbi:hypothetical protein DMC30DRAFT_289143 [Rhodotorula diobovata]|uniref:Ser-Thr-rich glycosyl-phosphatidyl-inositol-anchored membrane family-domain-containing protein n=1 Tax=Rhodotorula diobovata TaxID=5288 RepID=A0A5C5FU45_9BASI|nr:hypothetical protein DMC30DRAFT_289143 [Rhodotorula diobovata]